MSVYFVVSCSLCPGVAVVFARYHGVTVSVCDSELSRTVGDL